MKVWLDLILWDLPLSGGMDPPAKSYLVAQALGTM